MQDLEQLKSMLGESKASKAVLAACMQQREEQSNGQETVDFPGLANLLDLRFVPGASGIAVDRDNSQSWSSRQQWAAETLPQTLPAEHGFDNDTTSRMANDLVDFSQMCHDQQILVECAVSRQYTQKACQKLAHKWIGGKAEDVIDIEAETEKAEVRDRRRLLCKLS